MNNKLEGMWKETVLAWFEVLDGLCLKEYVFENGNAQYRSGDLPGFYSVDTVAEGAWSWWMALTSRESEYI
jgi:hypothetical protein